MLGNKIFYYRKKRKLTQSELAHGICSIPYLSKIENDKIIPNQDIVNLLFERLGVDFKGISSKKDWENNLNDWYRAIEERDLKLVDKLKSELENEMEFIQVPSLKAHFHLMNWRYHLTYSGLEECEVSYSKVKSYVDIFNENLNYLYYKFSCIHYLNKNEFHVALEKSKHANRFKKKLGIIDVEFQYMLVLIYSELNRTSLAISTGQKVLEIFQQQNNLLKIAKCQIALGFSFSKILEFDEAQNYFEAALKILKSIGDEGTSEGIAYLNLGRLHSKKKESKKAVEFYLKALENQKYAANESTMNIISELVYEYYKLDNFDEAKKWLDKGLSISKELDVFSIYLDVFNLLIHDRKEELAIYLESTVLPYLKGKKDWENIAISANLLGDYYSKKMHYKDAAKYYKLAYMYSKKLHNPGGTKFDKVF